MYVCVYTYIYIYIYCKEQAVSGQIWTLGPRRTRDGPESPKVIYYNMIYYTKVQSTILYII